MNDTTTTDSLSPGYHLDNYVIERILGGGGFSLVYLAHVVDSDIQVIIKEYMPRKVAQRDSDGLTVRPKQESDRDRFTHGQRLFLQEAGKLADLKHPNIVNVINFFRENGTVYMVMAYEKGVNLLDYIKRHDGRLSEKLIQVIFLPLLDGLQVIHDKGLLHLDIKPGNIYLRPGAQPLLLDFGAVHEMQQSRQSLPGQVLTPGFSPIEQSTYGGYVGPWTDIYAIGATMRSCIEGRPPPPAKLRYMDDTMVPAVEQFKRSYSPGLLKAIDWSMEVNQELRPQNIDELVDAIKASVKPTKKKKGSSEGGDNGPSVLSRISNSMPWNKG